MKRSLIHLSIAALLLVASVTGYTLWYLQVQKMGSRVVEADVRISAKSEEAAHIREARDALAALSASEERVYSYFVPSGQIVPFLESIGTTGEELGTDVEVVSVREEGADSGRGTVILALRIDGSFDAVMRTIGTFEYAPYDIVLTNLSIDAVDQGEEGSVWAASATYEVGTQAL